MIEYTTPTGRYHVTSHGNGWAYTITCQQTGADLWFQDHDAQMLSDTTDGLANEDAIAHYFELMGG